MMKQLIDPSIIGLNTVVARCKFEGFAHRKKRIKDKFLGHDAELATRPLGLCKHINAHHLNRTRRGPI